MLLSSSPAILSLVVAGLLTLGLGIVVLVLWRRREEIKSYERITRERNEAIAKGSHKARLIYPDIDLSKCIGCGSCVRACPEDGVLDLLHGQAVVVHGARCVGHGRCAEACPTAAIALTFADLNTRTDLPAISSEFEAVDSPGLYLAGELTGFSLVRTAVTHGTAVADAVKHRLKSTPSAASDRIVDLLIVGCGPAGVACALRAKELGIAFDMIEQADEVGGTVAAYPRKKLVMTQPMVLPLHGSLPQLEYMKEELVELWKGLIEKHRLPVRTGVRLTGVVRDDAGIYTAETSKGPVRARNVCLCLGRRGTPRKLGVPGEDLPKVLYSLIDAESYNGRHVLVIGSGDSAVEAAIALGEQDGNTVTLAARSKDLPRIKSKNQARLNHAAAEKRVQLLIDASPRRIDEKSVVLAQTVDGAERTVELPNDDVFVCIGGDPPFELLKRSGVSFDPSLRPKPAAQPDNTTPLLVATTLLLMVGVTILGWAGFQYGYYGATAATRTLVDDHRWLRPGGVLGLSMGLLAVALFVWNLLYLGRRKQSIGRFLPGSLRSWMGSHVFTGIASFLCVLVHAGFTYRMTLGGFAYLTLGIVLLAGFIGRYFYAIVPREANGREMELDAARARLGGLAAEWDKKSRGLGATVRDRVEALIAQDRWRPSLASRIWGMVTAHLRIRRALHELRMDPRFADIPESERDEIMELARRSMRLTLQIAHFEEIRAVVGSWRFFHRWVALLMILFAIGHIYVAVRYARLDWPFIGPREGAAVASATDATAPEDPR